MQRTLWSTVAATTFLTALPTAGGIFLIRGLHSDGFWMTMAGYATLCLWACIINALVLDTFYATRRIESVGPADDLRIVGPDETEEEALARPQDEVEKRLSRFMDE
jgi:hypothetical protein